MQKDISKIVEIFLLSLLCIIQYCAMVQQGYKNSKGLLSPAENMDMPLSGAGLTPALHWLVLCGTSATYGVPLSLQSHNEYSTGCMFFGNDDENTSLAETLLQCVTCNF